MVIFAPELLASLAFGAWRASSVGSSILKEFGLGNVKDWSRRHAGFANMGGIKFQMCRGGEEMPDTTAIYECRKLLYHLLSSKEREYTTLQEINGTVHDTKTGLCAWTERKSTTVMAFCSP